MVLSVRFYMTTLRASFRAELLKSPFLDAILRKQVCLRCLLGHLRLGRLNTCSYSEQLFRIC
jgi:hypothetical protein